MRQGKYAVSEIVMPISFPHSNYFHIVYLNYVWRENELSVTYPERSVSSI